MSKLGQKYLVGNTEANWKARGEAMQEQQKRQRLKRNTLRKIVIDSYGHRCNCCGEDNYAFLCIDHVIPIHQSGNKRHTNQVLFLKSIIDSGFPPDYQILCYNCNSAKQVYGICPHRYVK